MAVKISGTNIVYFPVPKIACTSMKIAIARYQIKGFSEHEKKERIKNMEGGIYTGGYDYVHKIYPSDIVYLKSYFSPRKRGKWVCVVRDPVKRFLSGYSNRICYHGDLRNSPLAREMKSAKLNLDPDIDEFISKLDEYCKIDRRINHHFRPMWHFLGALPARYYKIFDIGELSSFESFLNSEGAEIDIPHEQSGGPKISASKISEDLIGKIRRYYRNDYFLYGKYVSN